MHVTVIACFVAKKYNAVYNPIKVKIKRVSIYLYRKKLIGLSENKKHLCIFTVSRVFIYYFTRSIMVMHETKNTPLARIYLTFFLLIKHTKVR